MHGLVLFIITLAVGYGILTNGGFPGRDHAFAAPVTTLSMPAAISSSAPPAAGTVLRSMPVNKTIPKQVTVPAEQRAEADRFVALGVTPTATAQAGTEDGVVRAALEPEAPVLPPYQVYTVQDGDTVSSIAARFGVSPEYIVANNAEVQNADFLTLGQAVIIPAGNGILHEVRYGETLSDIAERYGVTVDAISGFASNGINDANSVLETQLVYVPGGTIPQAAPAAPAAADTPADSGGGATGGDGTGASSPGDAAPPPASSGAGETVSSAPASSSGLIWPVVGPISSYYGPSHPLGIDIDGFNLVGSPIRAATSGTVVFAGGNACCSYGLYVVIMSPDGIETLYGHLSSIGVSQGETVSQGESIGIIGSTGYSTGTHLHFEVIDNGVRQNPLDYLP